VGRVRVRTTEMSEAEANVKATATPKKHQHLRTGWRADVVRALVGARDQARDHIPRASAYEDADAVTKGVRKALDSRAALGEGDAVFETESHDGVPRAHDDAAAHDDTVRLWDALCLVVAFGRQPLYGAAVRLLVERRALTDTCCITFSSPRAPSLDPSSSWFFLTAAGRAARVESAYKNARRRHHVHAAYLRGCAATCDEPFGVSADGVVTVTFRPLVHMIAGVGAAAPFPHGRVSDPARPHAHAGAPASGRACAHAFEMLAAFFQLPPPPPHALPRTAPYYLRVRVPRTPAGLVSWLARAMDTAGAGYGPFVRGGGGGAATAAGFGTGTCDMAVEAVCLRFYGVLAATEHETRGDAKRTRARADVASLVRVVDVVFGPFVAPLRLPIARVAGFLCGQGSPTPDDAAVLAAAQAQAAATTRHTHADAARRAAEADA